MAGLFRKRQFKPWIESSVISKEKNLRSKVVKILFRRSAKGALGPVVMLVSDGELSIFAVFSEQAVDNALSNLGLGPDSSWDTALLILHDFSVELNLKSGKDTGYFVLCVEKFNIWDLQPGYHAKFDVKYCMEHTKVREVMLEEITDMKERAACLSQSNRTGSIPLTQLLDEMAQPSESLSQSCSEENEDGKADVIESLMKKLVQPFTVEEFLIPPSQAALLQNIPEWQPDYQPPSSAEIDGDSLAVSDQLFDVAAVNTLSSMGENVKDRGGNLELSQDVIYLGISVSQPENTDMEVAKVERQSQDPISAPLKHSNIDSQSQGASSQWQEEVDSIRFSFESHDGSQYLNAGFPDGTSKHVDTLEETSRTSEKDSCEFVSNKILKETICTVVGEKGRQVCRTDAPVPLSQANSKENSDTPLGKEISKEEGNSCVTNVHSETEGVITHVTKKDLEESLDLGSPAAQSTQIDEVVYVKTRDADRSITENVEGVLENTEENADVFLERSKANIPDVESLGQSSVEVKLADNVSKSKINENLIVSQNNNSVLDQADNDDFENEAKIDTSEDNIPSSSSSDLDKSVMMNYYSQNSSSPDRNWNNVLLGLMEKKKKLAALNYIVQQISLTTCEPRKSADCITTAPLLIESSNSCKTAEDNVSEPAENIKEGGFEDKLLEDRSRMAESQTDSFSDVFKTEDLLDTENTSKLEEMNNEDQSEVNTVETVDTGYPLTTLSLGEDSTSCLLSPDIALDHTDLEVVDRIHCENIAKYADAHAREGFEQDGDQSDLDIIGYSNKRYSSLKTEMNRLSMEKNTLVKCKQGTLSGYPLAPAYFETEPGSKRRSKRLYAKVVSCRQKDNQINFEHKGNSSAVSFEINDNMDSISSKVREKANEIDDDGLDVDRHVSRQGDKYIGHVGNIYVGPVQEAGVEAAKPQAEVVMLEQSANHLFNESDRVQRSSGLKLNRTANVTSQITSSDKETFNAENSTTRITTKLRENSVKNVSERTSTKWKLKKDVRIILERCDQKGNDGMKGNMLEQGAETVSCMSENRPSTYTENEKRDESQPSLKVSFKRVEDKYKIIDKKANTKHRYVNNDIMVSRCRNSRAKCTREVKKKTKLKRKKPVLEIVTDSNTESGNVADSMEDSCREGETFTNSTANSHSKSEKVADSSLDSSKNSEIIPDSTDNSCTESEIIAFSPSFVRFKNHTVGETGQRIRESNDIEINELSDSAKCKDENLKSVTQADSSISESEMENENSEETEILVEDNKSENNVTEQKAVRERTNIGSFEDQFKAWIEKGHISSDKEIDESVHCQNRSRFNNVAVTPDKGGQKNEKTALLDEGTCLTQECLQKDESLNQCDQGSLNSPTQCTQPFEICPYPQTQEFVPKLSETLVQTSLMESQNACHDESLSKNKILKNSDIPQTQEIVPEVTQSQTQTTLNTSVLNGNNESLNESTIFEDSDKKRELSCSEECNDLTEVGKDTVKELEVDSTKECSSNEEHDTFMRNSSPVKSTETVVLSSDKQVNVPFQQGDAHKERSYGGEKNITHPDTHVANKTSQLEQSGDTSDKTSEAEFGVAKNTTGVTSVKDEKFTKLMKKSDLHNISSKFWSISKPQKLSFKVKPAQGTNIRGKRKSVCDSFDNSPKKQKCIVEEYNKTLKDIEKAKVGLKQIEKQKVTVQLNETLDDLNNHLEVSDVNKSRSKRAENATKAVCLENVVVRDMENIPNTQDSTRKTCKTYEPRKIYIDGHCFGNKVCWQNFIESPYSASAAGEMKNKAFVEKTNRRKLNLNSSQGSQRKENVQNCSVIDGAKRNEVNMSSESLFSVENEENEVRDTSSESVSLLPGQKNKNIGLKRQADQTTLKEKSLKSLNENGSRCKNNSGDLFYGKVGGMLRFYRKKDSRYDINKDIDLKGKESVEKAVDKKTDKFTGIGKKELVPNKMFALDKKLFVQDWLMKNKKIGLQGSSPEEFSPPEMETSGTSQAAVDTSCKQACSTDKHRELSSNIVKVSTEKHPGKDNTWDDTSTSESSDSLESEDLDKPMSAAAKYMLKFRKARKEKKRKKLMELNQR